MLIFDRVSKVYGKNRIALSDVSFAVGRNEFVFVIGANGAGKSTLLKLATLQEAPTSGTLVVASLQVGGLGAPARSRLRRRLGIIPQENRLFYDRTAFANVALPLQVAGTGGRRLRERVHVTLDRVGMADFASVAVAELSGGQQQKVAIAKALANDPEVLIADEPTEALSPDASQAIMELLLQATQDGITALVATHDSAAVDRLRRRVITLSQGRITADDPAGTFSA